MKFWDTSAIVPLLVAEPERGRRLEALRDDSALAVWWGALVECESALQRRFREGALSMDEARDARHRLRALAESWHEVPPNMQLRTLAIRLLRTHPLQAADSLQLAAAIGLMQAGLPNLRFLSADHRLADAAEIEGLSVER